MYRSKLAQAAHEAILSYIRDKHDENKLKDAIDKLDEASMLELSMNGDSHLIDILHLPFEITNNQPAEKCRVMLHLLLKKATGLGSQVLISLLTQPNEAGFTPLHQALKSGNPENMRAYFTEVREAGRNKWIAQEAYHDLLLTPNQAGFTPLHQALKSGNPENMRAYFTEVREAVRDNWIDQEAYRDLLLKPNQAGFTPLHQAANSNSIEVVTFFLSELKEIVSLEGYRTALSALAKGHKPSCEQKKSHAIQINALLQDEKQKVDLSLRTTTGNSNHQSQTSKRLPQASFFHNNRHSDPNGLSQKYLPSTP